MAQVALANALPNIVLILADDMGIDSVAALNEHCGVATPHLDRLVREGMTFSDAHSPSAVCSPSRYALLTGRYSWRSRLKRGIVGKWERPLIADERLTLPEMLRERGYATTMIGKWHLGWLWPRQGGGVTEKLAEIDFTAPIAGGPIDHGFDTYFGDDVPNWPPFAWRENDRLLGKMTTNMRAGLLEGVNAGPAVADWDFHAVLLEYSRRCGQHVRERAEAKQPWFLYFPMPSPHTPIAPAPDFQGRSVSPYADFLVQTDAAVGEILRALDATGQAERTLVIFTADNGTSPKADFAQLEQQGVQLRHHWRGWKADAYEGGHRVPLMVRWPARVPAGALSDQVVSLVDLMATLASVVDYPLPGDAAEDSVSLQALLLGEPLTTPMHEAVICHSASGHFAVRRGDWKLLLCHGSGGWSPPREEAAKKQGLPPLQLYHLGRDPKETTNVYDQHPEIVAQLKATLRELVESGRSTPGPRQANSGGVWWPGLPWPRPSS